MIVERSSDVVVVASDVRVGAFSQLWLVESGVMPREMEAGSIFTPMVVNASSDLLQITVVPNRVQIASRKEAGISALPATAIRLLNSVDPGALSMIAAGINFRFVLSDNDPAANLAKTRKLLNPLPSLEPFFGGTNPRFGALAVKTDGRLITQLDVKPAKSVPAGTEVVMVSLNFHVDTQSRDEAVGELLSRFEALGASSLQLATNLDADLSR
jgi:hypothetical protein